MSFPPSRVVTKAMAPVEPGKAARAGPSATVKAIAAEMTSAAVRVVILFRSVLLVISLPLSPGGRGFQVPPPFFLPDTPPLGDRLPGGLLVVGGVVRQVRRVGAVRGPYPEDLEVPRALALEGDLLAVGGPGGVVVGAGVLREVDAP